MIVIGVTGTHGAGKGAVAEILKEGGFAHYSARELIVEEVKRRGRLVNRDTMTQTANELREEKGSDYIARALLTKAREGGRDAVIESIRAVGERRLLREIPHAFILAVDAKPEIRFERIQGRKSEADNVSFERFLADEKREWDNVDPTKGNIRAVMRDADYTIYNEGGIEELRAWVDKTLTDIRKRTT